MRRSAWRSSSSCKNLIDGEDELSESVFQTVRIQIQAGPARSSVMRRPWLDFVILLHHEGKVPDRFRLDPRYSDRIHWSFPFRYRLPNRSAPRPFPRLSRAVSMEVKTRVQAQVQAGPHRRPKWSPRLPRRHPCSTTRSRTSQTETRSLSSSAHSSGVNCFPAGDGFTMRHR